VQGRGDIALDEDEGAESHAGECFSVMCAEGAESGDGDARLEQRLLVGKGEGVEKELTVVTVGRHAGNIIAERRGIYCPTPRAVRGLRGNARGWDRGLPGPVEKVAITASRTRK